jgi:hypothetical protein
MNEKTEAAIAIAHTAQNLMYEAEKNAIKLIKQILAPCKNGGCLIGEEDYCDGIFHLYAEPEPNMFRRVSAIRYDKGKDKLELRIITEENDEHHAREEWIDFESAHIGDVRFLIDEIMCNIEYADGYQDDDESE